jgi:hypothetical protein
MIRSSLRKGLMTAALLLLPAVSLAAEPGWGGGRMHFITAPALVVITIGFVLLFISRREKRKLDLIERFVEKGQEIPASLLPQGPSAVREIRRGVWFTSLGLGWFFVLYLATSDARISGAWSVILLFLGAASFINAALLHQTSGSKRQG